MVQRFVMAILNRVPRSIADRFGSDSLLARLVRPIVNAALPAGSKVVTVRGGLAAGAQLRIRPRTEKFYWTGQHDLHVQQALAENLSPGMTFWDVGANIGLLTMLGSRLVGEDGHVLGFEPMPDSAARLEEAVRVNSARNTRVMRCAIGAQPGSATLHSDPGGLTWSLMEGHPDLQGGGIEVSVRTMDEVAAETGPPDVVKIDVEGAEVDVLRGGAAVLRQHRPTLIVEFWDDESLEKARGLLSDAYTFTPLGGLDWLLTAAAPSPASSDARGVAALRT